MNCRPRFLVYLVLALIFAGAAENSHAAFRACFPLVAPSDYAEWGLGSDGCTVPDKDTLPPLGDDFHSTLNCVINQITGEKKCVQGLDAGASRKTPPGWTGPETPPNPTSRYLAVNYEPGGWAPPNVALGQASCDYKHPGLNTTYGGLTNHNCYMTNGNVASGHQMQYLCPTGYTWQASPQHCSLTNPDAVEKPSDDVCQIQRQGNSFYDDPRDPDCDMSGQPGAPAWTNSGSEFSSSSSNGQTTQSINPDGTGQITNKTYDYSSNTTTTTNIYTSAPSGGGAPQVTGTSSTVSSGIGSGESETPNQPVDLDLPTDYARQNTLESLRADVADGIKLDETGTPEGVEGAFDEAITKLDENIASLDDVTEFEAVELPELLPSGGSCTSISGEIMGNSFSIPGGDGCDRLEVLKGILAWAFGIMTAIYVFVLAARRPA
jgi:hypothetical protein